MIHGEEEAFNKTLDRGIKFFEEIAKKELEGAESGGRSVGAGAKQGRLSGTMAFTLYDTYGFPLDLTELMARERGWTVDVEGFHKLMEEQRARGRAAQKKEVISLSEIDTTTPTQFVGYEKLETPAKILEVLSVKGKTGVILDSSPLYAEMGGQVGDTGEIAGAASRCHSEVWECLASFRRRRRCAGFG